MTDHRVRVSDRVTWVGGWGGVGGGDQGQAPAMGTGLGSLGLRLNAQVPGCQVQLVAGVCSAELR